MPSPMLKPALRLAVLVATLGAAPVLAQGGQNNYGSIYSRYGVGERMDYSSSQAEMLGVGGVALRDGAYAGLANPALWADYTVTTFGASVGIAGVRAVDASTAEASRATAGDLTGLHLGIPLVPSRLGLTVAFRPYSRVRYRSATTGTLATDVDTTGYVLNREGDGGLQRISSGLGLRLGRAVQLGASADVLFGTFNYVQRTEFDTPGFVETRQSEATQVTGVTGTVGATVTARSLARDTDALIFGAAVTLPTRLSATRTLTLGQSLDRDTIAVTDGGRLTLPLVARGGVSYRTGARWLLAADALYEPWSSFESTLPVGGFDAAGGDELQDRFRLGLGAEVTPAGGTRSQSAGIFRRAAYRLGGYAERGLYAPADATVMTYAVGGGVSFPNRITGARLDLGLEVGTRGSTEGVLVRDTFLRGTFTLNFGERWFIRRRFD